ncbi:MAG: MerR family transcriptional regulator [Planctomycetaceae bacterium]|nr:MerR family transcriptional regulator [Planctomycetaceae bacterium]
MSIQSKYIGVGLYSIPQAARLLGVRSRLLRYWIGEVSGADSIIKRQLTDEHLLTFAELMELHFIKMFRDKDVSLPAIRKAASEAARRFGSDYPFTVRRFDTDGTSIFATLTSKETQRELVEELRHGQFVFRKLIKPFFKKMDYCGTAEIERFWPMKKTGRVVLDPARRFGQPIDSGTGVPTETIFNAINAGDGQDVPTVAKWFDIPVEAVKAAIRFERSLAS